MTGNENQHARIFGQWPWKNPLGENKSQREYFYFLGEVYHLQQYTKNIKPTYLNPQDKFLSRFAC